MYRNFFKRCIDVLLALSAIILLLPIFIIVAIWIKLDSRGPIFFTQTRVGKDLCNITILKFRSMTDEKREVGRVIGRSAGVTRIGYYLRRFKIDELPQLFNILRGDMSIVGPRPSIRAQLDNMTEEQKLRYSVRPGLTGLAQVSGNIHLSWSERYVYDLRYVRNINFWNDLRIILRTVLLVIQGEEKFLRKPLNIQTTDEDTRR